MLIRDLIEIWLQNKKATVKKSTFANYYTMVHKHIWSDFGHLSLEDIKDNETFFVKLALEKSIYLSSKTVRDIFIIIKSIFDFALKRKFIIEPLNIVIPKAKSKEIETLTKNEIHILTDYLTKNIDNPINLGILYALSTGIRIGELCAIRGRKINIETQSIMIDESIQRIKNFDPSIHSKSIIIVDTPKSSKSIRTLPIPEFLLSKFEPYSHDDNYLLTGTSSPMEPRTLQYHFAKILNHLGLAKHNFHALRHTFATNALINGMDIKTLSEILGHSSVKITLDLYCHSNFERKLEEINRISSLFTA